MLTCALQFDDVTTLSTKGLALCALVNKFQPDAIKFESLDKANATGNLKLAMDAAARYFKVEQFLTPEELIVRIILCYMTHNYDSLCALYNHTNRTNRTNRTEHGTRNTQL